MSLLALLAAKEVVTHEIKVTHTTYDYFEWLTVILPVIVTLMIFIGAYTFNDLIEKRKERKRLKNVKEYFLALIKGLTTSITLQVNDIKAAKIRINSLSGNHLTARMVSSLNTNRISSIPDIDLFNIYINNSLNVDTRTAQLLRLTAQFDFLDDVKKLLLQVNEALNKSLEDFHGDHINKINELINYNRDEYKKYVGGDYGVNEDLISLISFIGNNLTMKTNDERQYNNDVADLHNLLIRPLYEDPEYRKFARNEVTFNILHRIEILKADFRLLESAMSNIISEFDDIIIHFSNAKAEIEDSINKLS